jgi:hypothetical protein
LNSGAFDIEGAGYYDASSTRGNSDGEKESIRPGSRY